MKGVPLAEKVNLHVSWPSVGLSVLDCGSREQMTPLVRAHSFQATLHVAL